MFASRLLRLFGQLVVTVLLLVAAWKTYSLVDTTTGKVLWGILWVVVLGAQLYFIGWDSNQQRKLEALVNQQLDDAQDAMDDAIREPGDDRPYARHLSGDLTMVPGGTLITSTPVNAGMCRAFPALICKSPDICLTGPCQRERFASLTRG